MANYTIWVFLNDILFCLKRSQITKSTNEIQLFHKHVIIVITFYVKLATVVK